MKIPSHFELDEVDEAVHQFRKTAIKMSIKHGIAIMAMQETDDNSIIRLYFQIDGFEHEFESLNDLKIAIKNKAFM